MPAITHYQKVIQLLYEDIRWIEDQGTVASYIPELSHVDPGHFGIHISTIGGEGYGIGDYQTGFSIQSIAKVFALCLAYGQLGETLWQRVGVEPSGTGFNSLVQLEADLGIPRNPFKNAGAMVICDILLSHYADPKTTLLDFCRSLSGNPELNFSEKISMSEKSAGYRNVALCNFIKSFGNIHNTPEAVLDFYFDMCALVMNCAELSTAFTFLARGGKHPDNESQILTSSQTKRINALMQMCGFYDESGEFAFKVGLPGKSGVGGGIIAVHPGHYTIAVWSPRLNAKGNSYKGVRFLEEFTTRTEQSIF
jgi:glutaminase